MTVKTAANRGKKGNKGNQKGKTYIFRFVSN